MNDVSKHCLGRGLWGVLVFNDLLRSWTCNQSDVFYMVFFYFVVLLDLDLILILILILISSWETHGKGERRGVEVEVEVVLERGSRLRRVAIAAGKNTAKRSKCDQIAERSNRNDAHRFYQGT